MGKAPAFQFYVRDWLSDPQLKMASHSTKGIWIDLLAFMWDSPTRGLITGTKEQIQKMVGANSSDFELFLSEINELKFADFAHSNNYVTIRNRRMYRDQKIRENTRKRVGRYRAKKASNAQSNSYVTHPSSTASSRNKKALQRNANVTGDNEPPNYKNGVKVLKEKGMLK